jgi:hypothetical protein
MIERLLGDLFEGQLICQIEHLVIQSKHLYTRKSGNIPKDGGHGAQGVAHSLDIPFRQPMCVFSPFVIQVTSPMRPLNVSMNSRTVNRLALHLDGLTRFRKRYIGNVQNEIASLRSFKQCDGFRKLMMGGRRHTASSFQRISGVYSV